MAPLLNVLRRLRARQASARRHSPARSLAATLRPAALGALLLATALLAGSPARAQSDSDGDTGPLKHSHEMQVWVSDLHVVPSLTPMKQKAEIVELGGRYGWVLTNPYGPGPLHGELEYAVDFSPLMFAVQSNGETSGGELNPIVMKWNFREHRHFHLYAEWFGGGTWSFGLMPPDGTHLNFSSGGAIGVQIKRSDRLFWSADLRFHHISDAHILPNDPTYNGVEVRLSLGFFRTHPAFPFSRAPR